MQVSGGSLTRVRRAVLNGGARERSAVMAGRLLLLTAVANGVMVIGRLAAGADGTTLIGSLIAISENRSMYVLAGVARLVSGITLFGAAWYLPRTPLFRPLSRLPVLGMGICLALSGAFTAASGALAIALAALAPEVVPLGALSPLLGLADLTSDLRWSTGKIGFALAGLAVLAIAGFQWQSRGVLRHLAPWSASIAIAMQFIWIDSATIVHRIVGGVFWLWLVGFGVLLLTGRTGEPDRPATTVILGVEG